MRSYISAGLLLAAAACSGGTTEWLVGDVGAEPSSFVVLAGNWAVREENGERLLRVDGTAWTPGTPPALLESKAAVVFPNHAQAFTARVLKGLQFPFGVLQPVETFSNGEIAVDFRLIGGASDQFASILFGLDADANHYAFRYNTKDGDTALWKVVDGQRERIHHGGVHLTVPLNEWRTLRLQVNGAQVTGFVNDQQTLQYTFPSAITGRIGLWSKADSVTDYRNYRVAQR